MFRKTIQLKSLSCTCDLERADSYFFAWLTNALLFVEMTYSSHILNQMIFWILPFWWVPSANVKTGDGVCSGFICWLFCIQSPYSVTPWFYNSPDQEILLYTSSKPVVMAVSCSVFQEERDNGSPFLRRVLHILEGYNNPPSEASHSRLWRKFGSWSRPSN